MHTTQQQSVLHLAQFGVSLVEGLLCLTIVSVLASLAAPEFRGALAKQRVAAVKNELIASLHWARSEAVRRSMLVTLQRRTDCAQVLLTDDDWSCGWRGVTGDIAARSTVTAEKDVLQTFSVPGGLRVTHPGGGDSLRFTQSGQPLLVANKFIVSPRSDGADNGWVKRATTTLCINRTGRIRSVEGKTIC